MTIESPLFAMLRDIREVDMSVVDRELLKPAFAALDAGQVTALPTRVIARVRDIYARMPKREVA